jgi:hypothetical protein
VPTDWAAILFSPGVRVQIPHIPLAGYLTGASCVAAMGAWYVLRGEYHAEARIMPPADAGLSRSQLRRLPRQGRSRRGTLLVGGTNWMNSLSGLIHTLTKGVAP